MIFLLIFLVLAVEQVVHADECKNCWGSNPFTVHHTLDSLKTGDCFNPPAEIKIYSVDNIERPWFTHLEISSTYHRVLAGGFDRALVDKLGKAISTTSCAKRVWIGYHLLYNLFKDYPPVIQSASGYVPQSHLTESWVLTSRDPTSRGTHESCMEILNYKGKYVINDNNCWTSLAGLTEQTLTQASYQ